MARHLKVAADCNTSQHPQTQTKENFINRSWFAIKPSTTGRSPARSTSSTPRSRQLLRASGDTDLQPLGREGAAALPSGPHSRVTPRPLGWRVQRRHHIGWTTIRTPAESGSTGQGGDRGTGQAGSEPRRRDTHARPPDRGRGEVSPQLPDSGTSRRTAAGAAAPREAREQEGGCRGLELPGPGQLPTSRGHAASLPESGRTRTGRRGEKAAGRGGRPRVPLPSPPPARGAPGGSDGGAAGPGRFT